MMKVFFMPLLVWHYSFYQIVAARYIIVRRSGFAPGYASAYAELKLLKSLKRG
jgi:hypothetical protein